MTNTTIVFYTDNSLPEKFFGFVKDRLVMAANGNPIISVSQKPIELGKNICVGELGRSHLSMYRQLLAGGEAATTDYIALAEHDCLYTPEHFEWVPPDNGKFFYNVNHWFVQLSGRHFGEYSYFRRKVLSQLICARDVFIKAVSEKVWMLEHGWMIKKGQGGACEPGAIPPEDSMTRVLPCEPGVYDERKEYLACLAEFKDLGKENGRWQAVAFRTELPNLDVRHGGNFSGGRRYKKKTAYELPYWGRFDSIWQS